MFNNDAGPKPRNTHLSQGNVSRRGLIKAGVTGAAITPLVTGLSGCNSNSEKQTKTTLRWSMWSDNPTETKIWRDRAQMVMEENPEIEVKLETSSFQNYFDKLATQIASGTEPDIISVQAQRLPEFAARETLHSLDPFIAQDNDFDVKKFAEPARAAMSYDDKIYGFAYDIGPSVLYYNRELFGKANIAPPNPKNPISRRHFRSLAKTMTDRQHGIYGYAQDPVFDAMVPWLWSNGATYMNKSQTRCTLGSKEAKDALRFITKLHVDDRVAAPVTDLAYENSGLEKFYSGQAAMYATGPWQTVNIKDNAKFKFGFLPVPAGHNGSVSYVAGSGFAVSSGTNHPDEAWKVVKGLTGKSNEHQLAKLGRAYPARIPQTVTFEKKHADVGNVDLIRDILENKVATVHAYRATPNWEQVNDMLTQNLIPILTGKLDVDHALDDVIPAFNLRLKQAKKLTSQ